MNKFLTFEEWCDWDDRLGHFEFLGGGTDREYEEWLEDEYDRELGAFLDKCANKINKRAGVAS